MADDRELFSQFRMQWWDAVSVIAWEKTCGAFQFSMQPAIATLVAFVVAAVIELIVVGGATTLADFRPTVFTGAVFAILFLGWYGVNVVRAARDVYDQDQQKSRILRQHWPTRNVTVDLTGVSAQGQVGDLAVAISEEKIKPADVVVKPPIQDRMITARIDGVKVRNERLGAAADFSAWMNRVRDWEDNAKNLLKEAREAELISLADYARFVTLDKGIPHEHWAHAISTNHNNQLRYLSRRIDILLEIMAKL